MGVFRKFPRTFWVANTIELFERWAWYGFFMLFANYLTDHPTWAVWNSHKAKKVYLWEWEQAYFTSFPY